MNRAPDVPAANRRAEWQAPCAARPDDWDLDIGGPSDWQRAIHICLACPALTSCGERVRLLTRKGIGPAAMIWAGVGYDSRGRAIDDVRTYRPARIRRSQKSTVVRRTVPSRVYRLDPELPTTFQDDP
ncbi:MAG: hypothetical protein HOQ24_07660 [Mycobacteriaceae bacterium]|nr:hypothetical protein [Mycobacteriaceae bacterium]